VAGFALTAAFLRHFGDLEFSICEYTFTVCPGVQRSITNDAISVTP
jgi:hypothetical protein